jgi:drug/metabolite transporter (DMT)-like permease
LSGLDSNFVAFCRLAISFLFFVAFLRIRKLNPGDIFILMLIGAVQFGLMYIFYIFSYQYLSAWQIALFTIVTPFYVSLINDFFNRKFNPVYMVSSLLSVAGAAVVVFKNSQNFSLQTGFILMQLSNICFATGQVWYKRIKFNNDLADKNLFAWLYTGAFILSGINMMIFTNPLEITITTNQIYVLLYLGVISSGICFFLWNIGATKVNAGSLAALNNLKIPLGIAAAIFIFGESADFIRMIISLLIIMAALLLSEKTGKHNGKR